MAKATKISGNSKAATGKGIQKADKAKVELAKAEKPQADKATPEKPLTMIQAAHKVLAGSKNPMTCREIVKAMKTQGLWETKTGLTPQNTLNAAINRTIKKGSKLFVKPEKGKYSAAS